MQLQINYGIEKVFISSHENSDEYDNQQCFMHRETYIKRKIPLNAAMTIEIDRI
jgi:hypothetical protein